MPQISPFLKPQASRPSASGGGDAPSEVEQTGVVKPPVAGFWRRLGAMIFDFLLFYALFRAAGWLFGDALLGLGKWTNVLGAGILMLYFVLGNGPVGKGRTVGKLITGLRVTDLDGGTVPLGRSLLRTVLLFPGIFFSCFIAPVVLDTDQYTQMVIGMTFSVLLMLGLFAGTALAIAFNPFKQGMHDHLTRTLVRPALAPQLSFDELCSMVGGNWRRYYKQAMINGTATFLLVFGVLLVLGTFNFLKNEESREQYEIARELIGTYFDKEVTASPQGFLPVEADPNNLKAIPPELDAAFRAELTDAASTAPLALVLTVTKPGRWGTPDAEMDGKVEAFIRDYHQRIYGSRMALIEAEGDKQLAKYVASQGESKGEEEEKGKAPLVLRNMLRRSVTYRVNLEERLGLFYPAVRINRVKEYEFSLPPVKDAPRLPVLDSSDVAPATEVKTGS